MTSHLPMKRPARRMPTQQRARERVEHILNVAEAMIVEAGVANLKTNEIAARAGIPVGSIYQYFSGLEEIVAALVDRYHRQIESQVGDQFASVETPEAFIGAVKSTLDLAWSFMIGNTGYRELWCGAQTWAPLRKMDWEDTLKNADAMNAALCRVFKNIPGDDLRIFCITLCDAAGSVARMTVEFPDLRDRLLDEWFAVVQARFLELGRRNMLHGTAG